MVLLLSTTDQATVEVAGQNSSSYYSIYINLTASAFSLASLFGMDGRLRECSRGLFEACLDVGLPIAVRNGRSGSGSVKTEPRVDSTVSICKLS
jgi:hypothetical protein